MIDSITALNLLSHHPPLRHMMTGQSLQQLLNILINHRYLKYNIYVPVLSLICPSLVSLPNIASGLSLAMVNVMSKVSNPSVILSQVTDKLALPSVAPAFIVILNGLELKSAPDPTTVQYVVSS